MRISTVQTSLAGLESVQSREAEIARLQDQISTGVRVSRPSDDPLAAAQAERARSRVVHAQLQQRNAQLASSVLATADGALGQGVDQLQRARELLVSAGDAALGTQDKQALALQLQSVRDHLLGVANTADGAGGYVFGGQGSNAGPVTGSSTPGYAPISGEQRIGEGGSVTTSVDGYATFFNVPQGNGVFTTASAAGNIGGAWVDTGSVANPNALTGHSYSISIANGAGGLTYDVTDTSTGAAVVSGVPYVSGSDIVFDGQRVKVSGTPAAGDSFSVAPAQAQSIFKTLDDAIALLKSPPAAANTYNEQLQRLQANLDRGLDSLVLMRSHVGEAARSADTTADAAAADELAATQRRSDLRDTDLPGAISQLQTAQAGLNAALQTYATIQRKSLFDMIG